MAFSKGSKAAVNEYDIYLSVWPPLTHGATYTLSAGGLTDESGNAMVEAAITFTYKVVGDGSTPSTAIQVNQQGYLPNSPKIASLGACCTVIQ